MMEGGAISSILLKKYQAIHAIIVHFLNVEAYSDSGGLIKVSNIL